MQKWLNLLQNINLTGEASRKAIVSQLQLSNFETETGIILPSEYKEFCQLFGSGRFGDLVVIYYPSVYLIENTKVTIDVIKRQMKRDTSRDNLEDRKKINWLNNLLVFGGDDRGNVAVWDLNSFDELNKTYNIYWIQIDDFHDEIYKISSNFFDFINNFCLGKKTFNFLPKYMRTLPCKNFASYKAM